MPFKAIRSLDYLLSTQNIPPKSHFQSVLKGNAEISDTDYQTFKNIWESLSISNLFEMFQLYLKLDTTLLADVLLNHYQTLFEITGLYLYHFLTIASYALASILKNTMDPIQKNRSLRLEVLDKNCYDVFQKILVSLSFFIFFHLFFIFFHLFSSFLIFFHLSILPIFSFLFPFFSFQKKKPNRLGAIRRSIVGMRTTMTAKTCQHR